jgi:CrcB protein
MSTSPIGQRPRIVLGIQTAIAAGGAIGALGRVAVDKALPPPASGWPWATFIVNLTGAFLLGYLATRLLERLPPSTYQRPLLGTGVCGAFTTFSTLQVEALRLARNGQAAIAAGYVLTSIVGGMVAIYGSTMLVRRARRGP